MSHVLGSLVPKVCHPQTNTAVKEMMLKLALLLWGTREAEERPLPGNADKLGRLTGKEGSRGDNNGYLFCWWGMCVCVWFS